MAENGITRRTAFGGFAAGFASLGLKASASAVKGDGHAATTLEHLKASAIENVATIHDSAIFTWTPGNFVGKADDLVIVASDHVALDSGAWIRQDDSKIQHRHSPSAKVTSVHGKLRNLVLADEDYGFRAGASPAANAAALQEAVNQAQTIQLPIGSDPIVFDGQIVIPPNTRLVGRGSGTRLLALGETAFSCEAPEGSGGELHAPWFEDFQLFCTGNGIRFNRAKGGFSDAGGQQALMRPRLDRVRIRRPVAGNAGSRGIEFNKCFDGIINQCEIDGFDVGYLGRGSDLIELSGRTRIWRCNTLIDLICVTNAPYRFGSGTRILGCDLLAAKERYLRSSDFDLLVEGCYFEHSVENGPLRDYAIDITAHDRVRFVGNRMQLQSINFADPPMPLVPSFLRVATDPGNLFVWEDNGNDGLAWGDVRWNNDTGQRYWINQTQRSRVIQRGTSGTRPLPFPFNSTDIPSTMPWRFSPSLPGLTNSDYGGRVMCKDDSFIIPYNAQDEGSIHFESVSAPISGVVDIWIQARADTHGKIVTLYNTQDGIFVAMAIQVLSTSFVWYKIFSNVAVSNLRPFLLNKDRINAGNVYVRELVIWPV